MHALCLFLAHLLHLPLALAAEAKRDPFSLQVQSYRLQNGMNVILHRDASLPQVVVGLWFGVGSKDERPGRTGFAHLYEHLMFMGTKNVPGSGFDEIMEAEGGHNNASTTTDRTFYYDTGPSQLLPLLLWLEAERLATLPEAMTDEKVALQREVVRNERRQNYENRPYGAADLLIPAAMYPKGHPYSWPVIGSHEDLLAATTEDVKQFFYRYYAASNATLVVAGDINVEETRRLITHYFGWMPKTRIRKKEAPRPLLRPVATSLSIEDRVELPRVILLWHAPDWRSADIHAAQLLLDLLVTGRSSRLYRGLVTEKQLAQEVTGELDRQELGSLLRIEITARKGVRMADLMKAVEAELRRLEAEPVLEEDLQRARNLRLTEMAREIEPLVQRAYLLAAMQVLHNDPQGLAREVELLRKVTPNDVQAFARRLHLVEPGHHLMLTVMPRTAAAPPQMPAGPSLSSVRHAAPPQGQAAEPPVEKPDLSPPFDLGRRPQLLPARPFVPPRAARFSVGPLDVIVVKREGAALMQAAVLVRAGSAQDGPGMSGLSNTVAALLTEGAGERSARMVAQALEQIGATLKTQVGQDGVLISLQVMAEQGAVALPILADVIMRPHLGRAEFERVKGERIAEVLRRRAEAAYGADRAAFTVLFGDKHPYAAPPLGSEASLRQLTLDQVREFHERLYRPENATLILVGDLEMTQAAVEWYGAPFAGWQRRSADPGLAEAGSQPGGFVETIPEAAQRVVLLDRPAAPQSELRIGRVAVSARSHERAAEEVANTLLGGSFTSRLNQNLREKHGYTYGARSSFLRLTHSGLFLAQAAVRTDATSESVREVFAELERMRREGVSQADLIKGRRTLLQRILSECERGEGLAQRYAEIAQHGLPLDELSLFVRGVQKATPEALKRVAQRYFAPDQMTVLVVGDRARIEEGLRDLNLPGGVSVLKDPTP